MRAIATPPSSPGRSGVGGSLRVLPALPPAPAPKCAETLQWEIEPSQHLSDGSSARSHVWRVQAVAAVRGASSAAPARGVLKLARASDAHRLAREAAVLAAAGRHSHLPHLLVAPQSVSALLGPEGAVGLPAGVAAPAGFPLHADAGYHGIVTGPFAAFGDLMDLFLALTQAAPGGVRCMRPAEVAFVLAQACSALSHLASRDLYHGDLKLEQLLVSGIRLVRASEAARSVRLDKRSGRVSVAAGQEAPPPPPEAAREARYAHVLTAIAADRAHRGVAAFEADPLLLLPTILVGDFDSAGRISESVGRVAVGTRHFTAVEVWLRVYGYPPSCIPPIRGDATDAFALGVLAWTLSAGGFPFWHADLNRPATGEAQKDLLVARAIKAGAVYTPLPACAEPMSPLLQSLLSHDPTARPPPSAVLQHACVVGVFPCLHEALAAHETSAGGAAAGGGGMPAVQEGEEDEEATAMGGAAASE